MLSLPALVAWTYDLICIALLLLAAYRLGMLCAWWRRPRRAADLAVTIPASASWPHVTVQLPIYNERFVARRVIAAAAALDYPADRLHIQVLDDSSDRTAALVRRLSAVWHRRGLDIEVVRRGHRGGYKAGALAQGLRRARGSLIAIFDADFVPAPDFLRRMVPHVLAPGVGVAQARWGHLDRNASWFTRLQAVLLDGHFAIEQPARAAHGWLATFNGTAGIWRREAIEGAGGWSSDTLTEDLDLSLRAQLAGWRLRYVDDVVVPAELPADCNAFRAQQRRWTQGGVQVARKMLPRIWRAPVARSAKIEATLHLLGYAAYPLLVALVLLRWPVHTWAAGEGLSMTLPGGILLLELCLLLLGTLPVALFYVRAQQAAGLDGGARHSLRDALLAMAMGAGLAPSNTVAAIAGLRDHVPAFERTPKRGAAARRSHPRRHAAGCAFYRGAGARFVWLELLLLMYLAATRLAPASTPRLGELPFLAFFAFGLGALTWRTFDDAWHTGRRFSSASARPASAAS